MNDTRRCPYCAEEVRVEAIKCKHCGSVLAERRPVSDWYRSADQRMVAGVCGGLALQFGLPPAVVRLAFVLMTLFMGGAGLVIYAALWIVMPLDDGLDDLPATRGPLRRP